MSRDIVCLPEPLFDDLYLSQAKYPLLPPIDDAEVDLCQTCIAPLILILLLPNQPDEGINAPAVVTPVTVTELARLTFPFESILTFSPVPSNPTANELSVLS